MIAQKKIFNFGKLCTNYWYQNGSYIYIFVHVHIRTCTYSYVYIFVRVHISFIYMYMLLKIDFLSGTMIPQKQIFQEKIFNLGTLCTKNWFQNGSYMYIFPVLHVHVQQCTWIWYHSRIFCNLKLSLDRLLLQMYLKIQLIDQLILIITNFNFNVPRKMFQKVFQK